MNKRKIAGYSVRLRAVYRRDGRSWIAAAPALQVGTQERTKKAALQGLREAVEAWFESCVSRGVLDQALREVGFKKMAPGESLAKAGLPPGTLFRLLQEVGHSFYPATEESSKGAGAGGQEP